MAKFLLRCAEDVDIFHAAAVIAGSVMKIALEMSLMIRAFEQTHASRYNNLCVVSDAVCTISLAWLQSLNVIIDVFTFVFRPHTSSMCLLKVFGDGACSLFCSWLPWQAVCFWSGCLSTDEGRRL